MGRVGEWARGGWDESVNAGSPSRPFAASPSRPPPPFPPRRFAPSPCHPITPSLTRRQYIKYITEHTRYERLAVGNSRFAFNDCGREIRNTEKFSERPITTTYLRYLKRPLRVVSHFKAVGRIEQERDWSIRIASVRMSLRKLHELFSEPAKRSQLKRILSWTRLKELIVSLFQIDRGSARHVVEVVTFAIPRQ